MTEPYYCCDLLPGMIADYEFSIDGHPAMTGKPGPSDLFGGYEGGLRWFDKHLRGPFVVTHASTGHWANHVIVSREDDLALVSRLLKGRIWTESIQGFGNKVPQKRLSLDDAYSQEWWPSADVVYGAAADLTFVQDWLRANPMPIEPVQKLLRHVELQKQNSEYLREIFNLKQRALRSSTG